MVKILIGLLAAIVIAAGAFFGFEFYVQQRVATEVEAAFAQVRAAGNKATHGKVSFDLFSRTITVADIAGESVAQPPMSVKIGRFTAAGVSQPFLHILQPISPRSNRAISKPATIIFDAYD